MRNFAADRGLAACRMLAVVLAGVALLCLGWRMAHGFYFPPFGDEVGHLLGAQSINGGGLLYRDYIDDHGPVPYALAQIYGVLAGWAHPTRARLIPALMAVAGILAVAGSPALQGRWERLVAAGTTAALLAAAWIVQGICLVDYQQMAGFLLLVALALFTAPAWAGVMPSRWMAACAGACCVFTCFVAYSYGPSAVMVFGGGVWAARGAGRALLLPVFAGAVAAFLIMVAWLAAFSDLRGFVVFHFIHSQLYYGPYLHYDPLMALRALVPGRGPWQRVQDVALAAAGLSVALFFGPLLRRRGWRVLGPTLLAGLALAFSNPRGSPIFQNGAFVVLSFGFFALAMARAPRAFGVVRGWLVPARFAVLASCVLAGLSAEAMCRRAYSTPHEFTRAQMLALQPIALGVSQGAWAVALRRAVAPNERMLALPFDPPLYFEAGRQPMRGYYLYLPWDADYARKPWFGVTHDLCVDMQKNPPPVVYYNGWVVWDRYDPRTYMPCVLGVIAKLYVPAPGAADFFVRRDRLKAWEGS